MLIILFFSKGCSEDISKDLDEHYSVALYLNYLSYLSYLRKMSANLTNVRNITNFKISSRSVRYLSAIFCFWHFVVSEMTHFGHADIKIR